MAFYWKYTRSGMYSNSYKSFIIDVLPDSFEFRNGRTFWITSFQELQAFLILLQDVEVLNNPSVGITKPAYAQFVMKLGFSATNMYKVSGRQFAAGSGVMGTHSGIPLPYGYIDFQNELIELDVTGLQYSAFPNGLNGTIPYHDDDKLLVYRSHPSFVAQGTYWDFMPKHSVILNIVPAMFEINAEKAENFLLNTLKWVRL